MLTEQQTSNVIAANKKTKQILAGHDLRSFRIRFGFAMRYCPTQIPWSNTQWKVCNAVKINVLVASDIASNCLSVHFLN